MPQQNLTDVARQLVDAFNAGDVKRFKTHLTANVVYDEVGSQRKFRGPDAYIQCWEQWRRAFPDVKGTITSTVLSGNTVVQEITWKGTLTGPIDLPGGTFPPSGKQQTTRATMVLTFEGEKVKEVHHYFDMMSLLQQIGAMPQRAAA